MGEALAVAPGPPRGEGRNELVRRGSVQDDGIRAGGELVLDPVRAVVPVSYRGTGQPLVRQDVAGVAQQIEVVGRIERAGVGVQTIVGAKPLEVGRVPAVDADRTSP